MCLSAHDHAAAPQSQPPEGSGRSRWLAGAGLAGLAGLALATWLNQAPAPAPVVAKEPARAAIPFVPRLQPQGLGTAAGGDYVTIQDTLSSAPPDPQGGAVRCAQDL